MDDLEEIKKRINIVDFIQEYFPLKKSGVNFKANCPFHQENTPSFVVSPERAIWHCFGCSKGGDVFKFLMEKEALTFPEALEILAKKSGVVLKRSKDISKDKKSKLLDLNLKAVEFFNYLLLNHKLGKKALAYLLDRGLTKETIETFQLGYAPNSWDSLTLFANKRGFSNDELIDSGLAVPSKRGCYDRFRGRIIFPLIDQKGLVIGFAGRVLDKGEPKYVNTPQTLIFDKSHFLFGLNLTKNEIRSQGSAILTEGEMDMILSYQSGVKNVVASKGTALTSGQIDLLKNYTQTLILSFDMDKAGEIASRRGIEIADEAGMNIKVIRIEEGKDPAELAKKDQSKWHKVVEEAEPIYDYYLRSAADRFNRNKVEDRRKMSEELFPIWRKISDPLVFDHYLQKLSALLGLSEEILKNEIKKIKVDKISYKKIDSVEESEKTLRSRRELLEEYLLSLLLHIPDELTFVPNFPETLFQSNINRSIYVLCVLYLDSISFKGRVFSIADFVKTLPQEFIGIVDKLYLMEINEKILQSKAWQDEVQVVVSELKKALVKSSLEKLAADIKNAQTFGKIEQLEALNKRFRDLSLKLKS